MVLLLLVGCSEPVADEQSVSIGYLRGLYGGYPRTLTEDYVIEGEVVSSDRYGAFLNQLVIQDPTGGISIMIDNPALHRSYSVGDLVRVWCRGLTLGGYGGSVRLGAGPERDWEVSRLGRAEWQRCSRVVGRREEVGSITRTIASLSADDMGRLVRVCGVRVIAAGELWPASGEALNVAVVDAASPTDTLLVRIVGHKELTDEVLPTGVVDVVGVADYFAGRYQLQLSSPMGFLEQ